jgi:6-phosphogluconolactonase (cycloisomerase 2 family)
MLKMSQVLLTAAVAMSAVLPLPMQAQSKSNSATGAVFVMTNNADKNQIIAYKRAADGSLTQTQTFNTGGRGSGGGIDPLTSQGSLTLGASHALLFAVNAGSGDISVFQIHASYLVLTDRVASGGSEPVAVAQRGNLVYVVNAGAASNVSGFRLGAGGKLAPIANSTVFLSTGNSGASSLAFSPDGTILLVTEKLTNNIDAFAVQSNGTLSAIVINPSAGPGLFSISFAPNGAAIATETGPAGGTNASAVSSYAVAANGTLTAISTSVPTFGTATCWSAITPNGQFVFTENAGTSTVSGFTIGSTGTLTAVGGTIVGTLATGATDLDAGISADGKFLYTLDSGAGEVGEFGINADGTLSNIGSAGGLTAAAGFNGLAAY